MKLYDKIKSGKVYMIAEMSANHAGKLENAIQIVHAAKQAGADCLKIQTYTADTLTIPCSNQYFQIEDGLWGGRTLYELYQEAYTPWEWQSVIKDACEKEGMDFLSTPFDPSAIDFLESLHVEMYKIASFELVDIPLIKYMAAKGKPMIMSCGMATAEEIQDAVDAAYSVGNKMLVLLKCTSEYPARLEDMNLSVIPDMQKRFHLPVGLSDHSMGSFVPVVAASMGACVIEKHFCLDRSLPNPDAAFSMEPAEYRGMVELVEKAIIVKGHVDYRLSDKERASMVFRRSLFAVKDIKKGEQFTDKNIRAIRPGYGMKPKFLEHVLSKTAAKDIMLGTPITEDVIDEK